VWPPARRVRAPSVTAPHVRSPCWRGRRSAPPDVACSSDAGRTPRLTRMTSSTPSTQHLPRRPKRAFAREERSSPSEAPRSPADEARLPTSRDLPTPEERLDTTVGRPPNRRHSTCHHAPKRAFAREEAPPPRRHLVRRTTKRASRRRATFRRPKNASTQPYDVLHTVEAMRTTTPGTSASRRRSVPLLGSTSFVGRGSAPPDVACSSDAQRPLRHNRMTSSTPSKQCVRRP